MNKEIKFRAWNTDKEIMQKGDFGLSKSVVCKLETLPNRNGTYRTELGEMFNGILLQFTGLKDKNGVEIYEGDIICDVIEIGSGKKDFFYHIAWADDIGPGWVGLPYFKKEARGRCFLSEMKLSLYEVVGNIYQNPEFL